MESPFKKDDSSEEEVKLEPSVMKLDEDNKSEVKEEVKTVSSLVEEAKEDELASELAPEPKEIVDRSIGKTPKQLILEQHGGVESNIPINSGYWHMK